MGCLPCSCAGSVASIHLSCFMKDALRNNRTACTICHVNYDFKDRVIKLKTGKRMKRVLQKDASFLLPLTAVGLTVAGVCFFVFGFLLGGSSARVGGVAAILIGAGMVLCVVAAWRNAYLGQPSALKERVLLSQPDRNTGAQSVVVVMDVTGGRSNFAPPIAAPARTTSMGGVLRSRTMVASDRGSGTARVGPGSVPDSTSDVAAGSSRSALQCEEPQDLLRPCPRCLRPNGTCGCLPTPVVYAWRSGDGDVWGVDGGGI